MGGPTAVDEVGSGPCAPQAALDKKQDVRELLESNPDLTRNDLNELVHTNAQLKDLCVRRRERRALPPAQRVSLRTHLRLSRLPPAAMRAP